MQTFSWFPGLLAFALTSSITVSLAMLIDTNLHVQRDLSPSTSAHIDTTQPLDAGQPLDVAKFSLPSDVKPALSFSSFAGLTDPVLRPYTTDNITRLANSTTEASIAFFIQISNSSIPFVTRLVSRLHHPANMYLLHFDLKIPSYRVVTVVATLRANPAYHNVHVLQREPVTYRGISMVLNTLAAVDRLLELGDWDYFINLSGSDYPLVHPSTIRRLLALPYLRERGANFFTSSPREQWMQAVADRFDHISIDPALAETTLSSVSATSTDRTRPPNLLILDEHSPLPALHDFEVVKGEAWVVMTRSASRFMAASAFSRKMLLAMALAQDPSEHFYGSLLWNHPVLNRTIVPHSLRSIYWKINGVSSGQHPYVIDRLVEKDGQFTLWQYLKMSPHLFARKFDDPESPILDWIDNRMNGLGSEVDEQAVKESVLRVEHHLHWLLDVLPENQQKRDQPSHWPVR